MMVPAVSVIVPCFNAEEFLEETIESVFAQTFKNWELILVNDGSNDKTEVICRKYLSLTTKIKYVYQSNSGVCEARNNGISQAIGEYILCLDADDLISPNFLEETIALFYKNPNLAVATSLVKFFGRSKGILKVVSYSLDVLLAENQLVITSLFKRKALYSFSGFNTNMNEGFEDWDFWISILKSGGEVECAENATFYYRLLNASRNRDITYQKEQRLRRQLWENHKELFALHFVNPVNSFEYKRLFKSPEYRVGKIIVTPIRVLLEIYMSIKSKIGN